MKANDLKMALLMIAFAMQGCGGGGGSSSNNDPEQPQTQTGIFVDSPVINVGYKTETKEGVTNAQGEYEYLEGETVTFFIGDLEFPPVEATGTVTPLDLAGTTDTADSTVINIIRLLQTLDQDGNPDNGITITDAAKAAATQVDFTLSESDFESADSVNDLISSGGQNVAVSELIDTADAVAHFEEQLAVNNISYGAIVGVWEGTGRPEVHVGESDLGVIVFLPDGHYYMAESNEINEGDGFEYGTYTFTRGVLSITTIVDTNDNIGFSTTGASFGLAIHLTGDTFTFPTNDPRESGDYTFTKRELSQSSLGGAWRNESGVALFVFLQNGEYLGFQPSEPNGFVGFEWGSYEFNDGSLAISTIDNSDGEALFCDQPVDNECQDESFEVSVQDGSFTLTVPEEGDYDFINQFD